MDIGYRKIDPNLYNCNMYKIRIIEQWCHEFVLCTIRDNLYFSGTLSFIVTYSFNTSSNPNDVVNNAYNMISDHVYQVVCAIEEEGGVM